MRKELTKVLVLFLFTGTLAITSCKKDSKEPNVSVVGKWKVEYFMEYQLQNNQPILNTGKKEFPTQESILEIGSDGSISSSEGANKTTGTYSVSSDNKKLTYNYIYEGAPESMVYDIKELTSNTLVLANLVDHRDIDPDFDPYWHEIYLSKVLSDN